MNLLKASISILFAAATVVFGTFVIQPSIADSNRAVMDLVQQIPGAKIAIATRKK